MNFADKKIFGTLFFSLFTTITGVGIVVPLLPIYAHDLGASGLYIGLIFGSFSLSRSFFLPVFGRMSDRRGRKPFIMIGMFAYCVVSIAFIWSPNVEALITIRFFQGIASAMIMPVVQAYVGDITPAGREGFNMGLFNMSVFFGLSVGPLAGGLIRDQFRLDAAFLCMGILAFVGFFLSLVLLPPTRTERIVVNRKQPAAWGKLLRDIELAGLFFFRFAYLCCIGAIWSFLPLIGAAQLGLSSTAIGFLIMEGILVSGLLHLPMGMLADRYDRRRMMVIGGSLIAVSMLGIAWGRDFWQLSIASFIFGLGGGISMPALMAIAVIKGNRTDAMGSVMAILTVAHSLGMLTGSVGAGLMMDLLALHYAFYCGTIMMALAVVWAGFGIGARNMVSSGA